MGCFSSYKPQSLQIPTAKYKQADELMPAATDWAKTNYPLAYGAREKGLGYMSSPQSLTDYYAGFKPTSFEEALGNQYFQNVWPDTLSQYRQSNAARGFDSPLFSEAEAGLKGDIQYDIGSFLANLGETRGTNMLTSLLGIDPSSVYSPYLNTDVSQSNLQSQADYEAAMNQAQANYADELRRAQESASKRQMWLSAASPVLSAVPYVGPLLGSAAQIGSQYYGGQSSGYQSKATGDNSNISDISKLLSQLGIKTPTTQSVDKTADSGGSGGMDIGNIIKAMLSQYGMKSWGG